LGADGWPDQKEGVATGVPGLYFVGLPFLRSFSSMLIGGVGRDAESVARHITSRHTAGRPAAPVPVAEGHD
jgi:putative flavoprotein involved in K+ transport